MTQNKVKEIIKNEFIKRQRDPAKIKAVAKAASKFMNKNKNAHSILVIDACLQMWHPDQDLDAYLKRNHCLFL